MAIRTAAVAAFAFLLSHSGLAAAPLDDFASACMNRGVRESACNCQAKIARATLDPTERRAALAAMTGGREAMMKVVSAMGEARAKAFAGKMQRLGERAQKECA